MVMKILTMDDRKSKKKAIEAAADIFGVDSIAADLKKQTVTLTGTRTMDAVSLVKKVKKVGKVEILSICPANEQMKDENKEQSKDEKT